MQFPGLRTELLDSEGELYRHVHIFINGRDVSFLSGGLDTVLQPDDQTGVFPAVGGGIKLIFTANRPSMGPSLSSR